MVSSSKFKPGIVALFAVGVVQQATALPQIELRSDNNPYLRVLSGLTSDGNVNPDCDAVTAALSSLKYGSGSISGVKCVSAGINTVNQVRE